MNALDAKLRVTAETGQASAAMKQLGKDAAGIGSGLVPARKSLDELSKASDEATKKLKDNAYRLSLLRPQITDIVTGLATGQSPFTVLLQQGGQLGDVFGGFGNALKALGTVFTPLRLLAAGLAAGLGTVVVAAFQGAQESDALRKSFALIGNAAGTTAGQVDTLAKSLAGARSASIGDARAVVAEIVATGRFSGAAIESTARSVLALGKLNGQTASENLKQFTSLADGVSAGAAKLNREYNFLSVEQFRLVRSMESQGRTQEAVDVVMRAFADTLEQRATPAIGAFERAWGGVKGVLSRILDDLKAIGRDQTLEEKIAASQQRQAQIDAARSSRGGRRQATFDAQSAAERVTNAALAAQAERDDAAATDAADRARKVQDAIRRESVAFQQAESAVQKAGIDKRLSQQQAALATERAAVEDANARALLTEAQHVQQLGDIELAGLKAQREALQRRLALEQAIRTGTEEEALAKRATVLGLEKQIAELEARQVQQAAATQTKLAGIQLDAARSAAREYVEVWQRAAQQVATFAQQVSAQRLRLTEDPAARVKAAVEAATEAERSRARDTGRDLGQQIDRARAADQPERVAELQAQLDTLRATAREALDIAGRAAAFKEAQAIAAETQTRFQAQEQAVRQRIDAGTMTEAEGEREILDLRRQQGLKLEEILALVEAVATTPEERNYAAQLKNTVTGLKNTSTALENIARSRAVDGLSTALTDIVTGAKTGKEALLDMVRSFVSAMLDALSRRLADQLVTQFLGAAGGSSGGGLLASIGSFFFHSGGVVGAGGTARQVPASAFLLAPRYHSGGIAGLMPDEVPAILRRGEEVLPADDPRHARNRRSGQAISSVVNVSVAPGASGGNPTQTGARLGRALEAAVHDVILNELRPGGVLSPR